MKVKKHKFYFNKKEKLSDIEIKEYSKTIKSKIKRETFQEIINNDRLKLRKTKSRISAFEKSWRMASSIIDRKYKGGSSATRNRRIADLVKESTYSDTGIVNEFKENKNLPFEENYKNAEVKTYHERTEGFFKKYGDRQDKSGFSLNDYLYWYDLGMIDKDTMNNIIKEFQVLFLSEYDSSVYKSRHTGRYG